MNFNFEILTAKHLNLLKDQIRDTLAAKNLDNTGEAGMSLEVQGTKLMGADYLYYLDKGRGPGKFPPVQNIRDWVRSKLGVEDKGVAFLVGRKISEQGTEIYKNSSKGIQLDDLVAEMLDELTKELPNEMAAEALKWV